MINKTTEEIVLALMEARKQGSQQLINTWAYELAVRLFIPNNQYTFEETLEGFGYKKIERVNDKQISIEEYMRSRKNDR